MPDINPAPGTRPLPIDLAAVRTTLAAVPALAAFATSFAPFSERMSTPRCAAATAAGRASGLDDHAALFAWHPVAEKALWVVSGRVGARALLAVIEADASGRSRTPAAR